MRNLIPHDARRVLRLITLSTSLILTTTAAAQIPYFAGTVGDGKLYGYSSLKVRPGFNRLET